jgi:hypothetical protein
MKKLKYLIATIVFVAVNQISKAETNTPDENKIEKSTPSSGEKCFDENSHVINLGVGLGSGAYYRGFSGGDYSASPAISLSYEQPWKQRLGPGFLGVGGYLGFQAARYRYDYYDYWGTNNRYYYQNKWNYFTVASRAAYHWDGLNKGKAELYAGVVLGLRIQTYDYYSNDPGDKGKHRLNESAVWPAYSTFVGGRYYFAKNFGVFFEAGYGISYATIGLTFKM